MAVKLTELEAEMLAGKHGKLKQQALKKVIEYAKALGATELCQVSKAHLFCGAHHYLEAYKPQDNDDLEEILSQMHLCSNEKFTFEKFACYSQADCGPMDPENYEYLGIDSEVGEKNKKYLDFYAKLNVALAGTCVPYMVGFLPLKGEHYVSSESHAVTMMNALWGACGNSDGLEAGFWSAICGRTPLWGNHLMDNRKGTHLFEVEHQVKTSFDWDILGYTIGLKLPTHSIPVLRGSQMQADIFNIKYFFAAMATTSGPEMCHIVGLTPEAPTVEAAFGDYRDYPVIKITQDDLDKSYKMLNDDQGGQADLISLGCPHYSIEELLHISEYLQGKKINPAVELNIWTAPSIKDMADRSGYTKVIEEAGGKVLTSSCPLTSGVFPAEKEKNILFDSAKQAHYIRPLTKAGIYYRPLQDCLEAAISGYIK